VSQSRAVAALFGSTVLVSLSQSTAGAAAPLLAHRFERVDLTAWLMGGYLLAATVAGPLFGKAGDVYGRGAVLQVALVVVLAASLACGLAWSMWSLIAFRVVQGIGGGGLITVASAAVADVLPVAQRPRYQGWITSTTSAVTVVGPVFGGLLIEWASWRWLFLVNVPVVVVLLAQVRRMPASQRRPADLDYVGAALLVTGIGALMAGLQWAAHAHSWGRPVLGTLSVAGVLLLGFFVRERVVPDPIVPLQLFADRAFSGCALLSLFGGATLFAGSLQLQQFMQLGLGISASHAGLHMLPMFVGLALASVLSGRRLSRRGRAGRQLLVGTAGIGAGMLVLTGLAHHASPSILIGGTLLLGCGLGVLMPTVGLLTQSTVPRAQLGAAMSVVMLLRSLGGAVGTALVGSLVAARLTGQLGSAASSFASGFPTMAAAAVPAVALALMMRHAIVPGLGPRHRLTGQGRGCGSAAGPCPGRR
jgi:MFS family permease